MPSDETKEPERLSLEWCEQWIARQIGGSDLRYTEQLTAIVQHLRHAARDAAELEVLRNYALEGDGVACEHCDSVCIPGADDSEEWLTERDDDEIQLCYRCSEKERDKVLAKWTGEAPDEE